MKVNLEFDTSSNISETEAEEIFEIALIEGVTTDDVVADLVRDGLRNRKLKQDPIQNDSGEEAA